MSNVGQRVARCLHRKGPLVVLTAVAVLALAATSVIASRGLAGGEAAWAQEAGQEDPLDPRKFQPTRAVAPRGAAQPEVATDPSAPVADAGPIDLSAPTNGLLNDNAGSTATGNFTQSEASTIAFGSTIIASFNDSGSNAGGTNKFTGWSRSTDGGATWVDGGTLPTNAVGDAGDPVLARDELTGRIYLMTLGFTDGNVIPVFRSDDNGATWQPPVNGTPGGASEDKPWITVDNFTGAGRGNVYLASRRFGTGPGIYFFRSTDGGSTYGPSGGIQITPGNQGAYVAVGPDHAVYVWWYAGSTLQMRKSTDQGLTFGPAVTAASGLVGGTNGDLGLTGIRQGTATPSNFRTSEFPHAAVNPVTGDLYVTYANDGLGTDKADVLLVQSTDGGATWSAPIVVNDDATTTDQWQPTIAVSPDGSRLGVFYYSRQEDVAGNNLFKYYGRIAAVSGSVLTFQPSFAVSDTASLPEFGRDSVVNSTYMGDYNTVAATPGAFHVVWSDNRDDLTGGAPRKDPNVYHARVSLGLAVTTTVPAQGSIVVTPPTAFTLNVTEPIDAPTLQAGDLTVNGIPADGVTYTPGTTTIGFSYSSSPVTSQGLQVMQVAAGSFTRAGDGQPVNDFTGTFLYDVSLLQVTSTIPPFPGGAFTLPSPVTYDLYLNDPVSPSSVTTTDLALTGIPGSAVTGVTVLPGNTNIRFTLTIPSEGTLTASIAAGAITDEFGNPGAAFSASYLVDTGTQPYPIPLAPKNPRGSLIYDPSVTGTIGTPGDIDGFTIPIDAGQTISVGVTATSAGLQPTVELRDPASAVIAAATAGAAGQPAWIQTAPAASGGTYTIEVGGLGGTTGNYAVQVVLNAALEDEGLGGPANDTLSTAQNIDGSFIALETPQASARRGAALGTTDDAGYTAAAVPFAFEDISSTGTVIGGLTGADDVSVSIPLGFPFPFYGTSHTSVFVSSNGLLTFGSANTSFTNADLTTSPTQAAIAPFWDDQIVSSTGRVLYQVLGSGATLRQVIQWNQTSFFSGGAAGDTITYQAVLYADGRIQLNYADLSSGTAPGNEGASATVGVKGAGTQGPNRLLLAFNNGPNGFVGTGKSALVTPPVPGPDLYAFALNAGDVVTLAVESVGLAAVDLIDGGGAVLATGVGATNLDGVVNSFAVSATGTYYARVTAPLGGASGYTLVVTSNAAFDTEDNSTFATAQPLAGNRGALGAIVPSGIYSAAAVPTEFEDISSTGTVIGGLTGADDVSVSIPLGFPFPFYGTSHTAVFVSSNGLMTFDAANTGFTNADLTTTPSQPAIAPFWDDQIVSSPGRVLYEVLGSGPTLRQVVQWNQTSFFSGGTAGDTITYQAVLYADGSVRFNYLDLASGSATGNDGGSATVGIKAAGTQGPDRLLLAFNNGPNAFVGTGKGTLITQSAGDDWYDVTVTSSPLRLETSTPADGPGEFVNALNPRIELFDLANVLVASGTPLSDGRNEAITAAVPVAGAYRVRVTGEAGTTGEYFVTARSAPPITPAGSTLVWEACGPENLAIDPGEQVTVGLSLTNNQLASTSNLVATLLATGGVESPDGPQSYGAIAPGGTGTANFTFTASPTLLPGQPITATLQLQDGATALGTAVFTFTAGPTPCGKAQLVASATLLRTSATKVSATITVTNTGTLTASAAKLTSAKLGSAKGAPLPQSLGNIAPGGSAAVVVVFTNSTPGASVKLKLGGKFSQGSFQQTLQVTIP